MANKNQLYYAAHSSQVVVMNYQGSESFTENVAYNTVSHKLRMPSPANMNYSDNIAYSTTRECKEDSSKQTVVYEELNWQWK